jgi:hypothetical protein
MSSLVNEVEKPTLWSEGEGRWAGAEITEVAWKKGSNCPWQIAKDVLSLALLFSLSSIFPRSTCPM